MTQLKSTNPKNYIIQFCSHVWMTEAFHLYFNFICLSIGLALMPKGKVAACFYLLFIWESKYAKKAKIMIHFWWKSKHYKEETTTKGFST
jgi:hypothetical protein